uniref:Secreted protein n=1 Tax=Anguilla anguilla TaxID=7936 RepID=A0A0E9R971_ANGAN
MGNVFSCARVCTWVRVLLLCSQNRPIRWVPAGCWGQLLFLTPVLRSAPCAFPHPSLYRKSPSATPNPLLLTGTHC